MQIAVGDANNIWAIDSAQRVYLYDSSTQQWVIIPYTYLTQIVVTFDGAVWGVNSDGGLYQWNSSSQTFSLVTAGVTNVAIGSDSAVFAWNKNTGTITGISSL